MTDRLAARFAGAAQAVLQLKQKPTDEEKLALYGYYKQATMGDAPSDAPSWIQVVARRKWQAWYQCRGMPSEVAKKQYIKTVNDCIRKYGKH